MPSRLLILLLTCIVPSAAAQVPAGPVPAPVPVLRPQWARAVWADPSPKRDWDRSDDPLGGFLGPGDEDSRYPGFFIGAGLGALVTIFSVSWCEDPDNACSTTRALLVGTMFTGMAGFGGAVLGGLIPRSEAPLRDWP